MKCTLRAMLEDEGKASIVEDVRWSTNVCSVCLEGLWRERVLYAVSEGNDGHIEST
jgi:hypothetical protein